MKKFLALLLSLVLLLGAMAACGAKGENGEAASTGNEKVIMIWGAEEHRESYLKFAEEFKAANPEAFKGYTFDFAGSGNAGAYANMAIDPTKGAAIYTFPNDQMANLANLNALSPLAASDLEWARNINIEAAVEATKLGDRYMAYPMQADNGFFMFVYKPAFEGTSVWDAEKDNLKDGYTFRELYAALDEKGGEFANALVSWPFGDSWYDSGIFFAVGGDYDVRYNSEGKQVAASCSFAYTLPEGETSYKNGDFTVGETAMECMLNTFMNEDGTINKHFLYTDADKVPYNDQVDFYTDPNGELVKETPLVATVNGTWKAGKLRDNWGAENYRATVLPLVEDNEGLKYTWKTFAGYMHLGVNPMCEYVSDNPENIVWLHKLAQYLTEKGPAIDRYQISGVGPANKEALEDEAVKNDIALMALNAQYARECVYPEGHALAGQPVGNGLGFRVQDSVPANYWTPIQNFAQTMWQEYSAFINDGTPLSSFSESKLHRTLAQLQTEIEQSAQ